MKLTGDLDFSKALPTSASPISAQQDDPTLMIVSDNIDNLSNAEGQRSEFEKIIKSIFSQPNLHSLISHLNPEQLKILNEQTGLSLMPLNVIEPNKISITGEECPKKPELLESTNQESDSESINSLARIKIEYNSSSRHQENKK